MEPARYSLAVLRDQPEDRWTALEAALAGSPPITMTRADGTVSFQAETWDPILQARVADALEAVRGHGEAWRTFGPLG